MIRTGHSGHAFLTHVTRVTPNAARGETVFPAPPRTVLFALVWAANYETIRTVCLSTARS